VAAAAGPPSTLSPLLPLILPLPLILSLQLPRLLPLIPPSWLLRPQPTAVQ